MTKNQTNILDVKNLKVYFYTEEGEVRAVNDVTFSVKRNRILGIVGESGCGKSVTSYSILRLIQKPGKIMGGEIIFSSPGKKPFDILKLGEKSEELFNLRGGEISMIFQEPMTALSPVLTIGNQVSEAILLHQDVDKKTANAKAIEMLRKVGIPGPEKRMRQYPFELSGGMRQRVVIAMALVCHPKLLIADEPTTALDVTIQAQIMRLMKELCQELGSSVVLITHDLGVIAQMADDVAVMYLGRIIEEAEAYGIMKTPRHPYTIGLLESLPGLHSKHEKLPSIKGSVPSLTQIPPGCPFHPRCPYYKEGLCDIGDPPPLQEVEGHGRVACLRINHVTAERNKINAETKKND